VSLAALVAATSEFEKPIERVSQLHSRTLRNLPRLEWAAITPVKARASSLHRSSSTTPLVRIVRPDMPLLNSIPHVVIFNLNETEDGRVNRLQEKELFRSQKYATAVYRINLAERLQRLGMRLRLTARAPPQIKGFSQEYLDASSPRRKEVERRSRRNEGTTGKLKEFSKGRCRIKPGGALADRRSKKFDHEEMKARHQEMDARCGNEARLAVEQAQERGPIVQKPEEIESYTQTAVTFARR